MVTHGGGVWAGVTEARRVKRTRRRVAGGRQCGDLFKVPDVVWIGAWTADLIREIIKE